MSASPGWARLPSIAKISSSNCFGRGDRLWPIEFSRDARKQLIHSIKQYFAENLEQDIGELKEALFLDFITKEIGPAIYNGAVSDVQVRMQEIVSELDGACFEREFTDWKN